jgi:hypothetical protein
MGSYRQYATIFLSIVTLASVSLRPALGQNIVLDVNNKMVGRLLEPSLVMRNLNGVWVYLSISLWGFLDQHPQFYYQSSNCTGQSYLIVDRVPVRGYVILTSFVVINGGKAGTTGTVYYPALPITRFAQHSTKILGTCSPDPTNKTILDYGPTHSTSITNWALKAPFRAD